MTVERIEIDGVTFAEVIRAGTQVDKSTFVSPADSSLQLGLLSHRAGYVEPVHYHKPIVREIKDLQQFIVVQTGIVLFTFHRMDGAQVGQVTLAPGDGIVLIDGAHSLVAVEDSQCISVKQGPFMGIENDKIELPS